MIYPIIPQKIPKDRRAEINEKIIYCIDANKNIISNDVIYNCFTGIGGLHGLKVKDFPNFNEYSKAKKKIEMGQFFTPHILCKQIVELVSPDQNDMVLEMYCGSGNFFNHLPNQHNAYGFDVEINSVKVAKHLYPDAHM